MLDLVLCSTPVHGHVTPLLEAARALAGEGNRVRFLTGARYRDQVEATGARWLPLPAEADYDDRDIDAAFPGRVGREGVDGAKWDLQHIFLDPAPAQLRAIDALLRAAPADAVLAESMFFGAMLLLGRPRATRPAVVNLGIVPLGLRSPDVAPFALGIPPRPGRLGRLRNRFLTWSTDRFVFRDLQRNAERMVREEVGFDLAAPAMDYPSLADAVIQFSVPGFEYPRSDLSVPVHFVGPVSLARSGDDALPDWWGDLDTDRPVIHVTQGTVANADHSALITPALRALADRDVLVVVTAGGKDVPRREVPANARIASYLPYDRLFPRLSGLITNGGYGGVHFALAHGVPIVATGNTEDKAEVAARVAWSGAGIRLRPRGGAVDADAIGRAVDAILTDPNYRRHATRIGEEIRRAPGPSGLADIIRNTIAANAAEPTPERQES